MTRAATTVADLLAAARAAGIEFRVVGGRVQFRPCPPPPEAAPVVERLRQHRAEAAALLRSTPGRVPRPGPCPVHGSAHCACVFSGRCGLDCPCGLCAGWRKALAWAEAHPEVYRRLQ